MVCIKMGSIYLKIIRRLGEGVSAKRFAVEFFWARTFYLLVTKRGFGKEVRRRILLGTYILSAGYYDAYYGKAQIARDILKKEFAREFKNVDLIATPTSTSVAWKIGEKSDPVSAYLEDIFTVTANIVGVPAMSVPSGFSEVEGKKLHVGNHFKASHGRDDLFFANVKKQI